MQELRNLLQDNESPREPDDSGPDDSGPRNNNEIIFSNKEHTGKFQDVIERHEKKDEKELKNDYSKGLQPRDETKKSHMLAHRRYNNGIFPLTPGLNLNRKMNQKHDIINMKKARRDKYYSVREEYPYNYEGYQYNNGYGYNNGTPVDYCGNGIFDNFNPIEEQAKLIYDLNFNQDQQYYINNLHKLNNISIQENEELKKDNEELAQNLLGVLQSYKNYTTNDNIDFPYTNNPDYYQNYDERGTYKNYYIDPTFDYKNINEPRRF
jgi:hypothetical protein